MRITIDSTEETNGTIKYVSYQIGINAENAIMSLSHKSDNPIVDYPLTTFTSFWSALSSIPTDYIEENLKQDNPDFYTLRYRPHDLYDNSSDSIRFLFYNRNGIMDSYIPAPSAMFRFTPMYQDVVEPNTYSGRNGVELYYYD